MYIHSTYTEVWMKGMERILQTNNYGTGVSQLSLVDVMIKSLCSPIKLAAIITIDENKHLIDVYIYICVYIHK